MKRVSACHWKGLSDDMVECSLCPHGCRIPEGRKGICGIRHNIGGQLFASAYGIYPAVHLDPIEKKPLNHFLPGSRILSVGSVGCNLSCLHCQNWSLARDSPEGKQPYFISPGEMARIAGKGDSIGVAYTYNEPAINHEYLLDVCPMVHEKGLKNVLVTNGYLSSGPWKELMEHTDAANIDVKGFNEGFYRDITGGELSPVIDNVESAVGMGVHVEIAYLVIPGRNDDNDQIDPFIDWMVGKLGGDVPVHFNRFHPDNQMMDVHPTPRDTLDRIRSRAMDRGIKYVFIGNMGGKDYDTTFCPSCNHPLIERMHFLLPSRMGIKDGKCRKCGMAIKGVWSS